MRGTRRCTHGRRLFLLRTRAQTEGTGHNCHDHDRFYQFQCISPPFPAGCSVLLGKDARRRNDFLDFFGTNRARVLRANRDRRAFLDEVEQLDHVVVAHANTTVAIGRADLVLVPRAVDVNKAVTRVGIVFFETVQPKNARGDQILGVRQRIVGF